MGETVKTYEIDLTGCPCCYNAGCIWCVFCGEKKSPVIARLTFAGFTGWASSMNRSFMVEIGAECEAVTGCRLEGYWAGVSCSEWTSIWHRIRLEVASSTQYSVVVQTLSDPMDNCSAAATTILSIALNPTWNNIGGGGTPNFDEESPGVGNCHQPGVAVGTTAVLGLAAATPTTMCCNDCSINPSNDSIDISGTTVTVEVLSVASLPSIATLTFTGTCAATLGGTVSMTWNSTSKKYEGSATECNMSYEYNPCTGVLSGTGDCTVSGTAAVTDLKPYAAECKSAADGGLGLTVSAGCACCDSVTDDSNTGFTIA